jgi:hypothetical protein
MDRFRLTTLLRTAASAGALALLAHQHAIGGHIYWTDRRTGQVSIRRMGLDGSAPTTVPALLSVSGDPRGIAVDVSRGKFYFGNTSVIVEANLDGTGAVNRITGQSAVRDMKIHRPGDQLYWCDQTGGAPGAGAGAGTIRKAALATFAVDSVDWKLAPDSYYMDIFTPTEIGRPAKIFWGNSGSSIFTTLLDAMTDDGATYASGLNVRGIAIDDSARMAYWCERDSKAIYRAPIDINGTLGSLIANPSAKELVISGLDAPHGIALDVRARRVYWVDSGSNSGTGAGDGGVSRCWMDPPFGGREILIGTANAAAPPRTAFQGQPWDLDLDLRTSTWAQWLARYFAFDAPAATTAPAANSDADSLTNLQEYAFGTHPGRADTAAVTVALQPAAPPGAVYLAITFPRRKNAADVLTYPQYSTDLQTWIDDVETDPPAPHFLLVQQSPLVADEDMETVTFRTAEAFPPGFRAFVRVKVR